MAQATGEEPSVTLSAQSSGEQDAGVLARRLGISREAAEIYLTSDVIDLHVDSFIWTRVFGYDLTRRHGPGLLGARYFSQVDFPRMNEARIGGALWSITTNPLRTARGRSQTFARNLDTLEGICNAASDQVTLVRTATDYESARRAGRHAVWVAVQGGNAFDGDHEALSILESRRVVAVTLVHLSRSRLGGSSSPLDWGQGGLTDLGREQVRRLGAMRVFVDLAHVNRRAFFDAIEAHDRRLPLLVTHTGVQAVTRSWRNLDDEQLRAVADTGGVVGVIFHGSFVGGSYLGGGRADFVAAHLEHVVRTVGEDHAALGSDWDGAIITPRDMPTCLELPRLVQCLLDRGLSPLSVQKILGQNFLRALRLLRG